MRIFERRYAGNESISDVPSNDDRLRIHTYSSHKSSPHAQYTLAHPYPNQRPRTLVRASTMKATPPG
jgi:hypothetical protein